MRLGKSSGGRGSVAAVTESRTCALVDRGGRRTAERRHQAQGTSGPRRRTADLDRRQARTYQYLSGRIARIGSVGWSTIRWWRTPTGSIAVSRVCSKYRSRWLLRASGCRRAADPRVAGCLDRRQGAGVLYYCSCTADGLAASGPGAGTAPGSRVSVAPRHRCGWHSACCSTPSSCAIRSTPASVEWRGHYVVLGAWITLDVAIRAVRRVVVR